MWNTKDGGEEEEEEQGKECIRSILGGHICEEPIWDLCVESWKMFFQLLRASFLHLGSLM